MTDAGSLERYLTTMEQVDGWFGRLDAEVMLRILDDQAQDGVVGDLLEIGVFAGKSAVLLGFGPRDGEQLHVCDPFDSLVVDDEATISERYRPPSRADFEARYRHEHGRPPVIHQCLSTELRAQIAAGSFRFVHVDGSHRYEQARLDLDLSLDLLVPGGVVCFDDYRTVVTPGVALAVWEAVAAGRLTVVALTASKCYCVARGDRAAARWQDGLKADPRFGWETYDLDDDVPALGVWRAGRGPEEHTGGRVTPTAVDRSRVAVAGTRVLDRLPAGLARRLRAVRYGIQARRNR